MKDKSDNREELIMFEKAAENAIASAANIGMFSLATQEFIPLTLLTPLTSPDLFMENKNIRYKSEENIEENKGV